MAFFEDLSGKKSGLVSVLFPGGSLFYALVLYNLVFQSDDLVLLCGDRCLWNFLRDKKFAGGVRPRVVVEPLQVEDGEIDIIIIKNDYYTPYFLEENYKGVNRISPQGV